VFVEVWYGLFGALPLPRGGSKCFFFGLSSVSADVSADVLLPAVAVEQVEALEDERCTTNAEEENGRFLFESISIPSIVRFLRCVDAEEEDDALDEIFESSCLFFLDLAEIEDEDAPADLPPLKEEETVFC